MVDGNASCSNIESGGGKPSLPPFNGHRAIKEIYFLDGDKFKARSVYKPRQGGNGFGLSNKNVSGTITVVDRHMVAIVYGKRKHK